MRRAATVARNPATSSRTPRVCVEDYPRPSHGPAERVRVSTFGANLDLVPGRVPLRIEEVLRRSGPRQARANTALALLQVRW